MVKHGVIYGNCNVRLFEQTPASRLRHIFSAENLIEKTLDSLEPPYKNQSILFCSAEYVVDIAIIRAMKKSENTLLVENDCVIMANLSGEHIAKAVKAIKAKKCFKTIEGVKVLSRYQLSDLYNDALRKRGVPFIEKVADARKKNIEWIMYNSAYKGVTDFLTKYAWRHLAFHITRWCAKMKVHPNFITIIGLALTIAAGWHFYHGNYTLGLIEAWVMMVLDTVDGKLARVTITDSPMGHVLDHGNDLIHPPFWWWAWLYGLGSYGTPLSPELNVLVFAATFGGYILGRIVEGIFIVTFGMDIHVWRPIDSYFRLFTARRNPNIFILTLSLIGGHPDLGIVLVGVWTLVSIVFYLVRYATAGLVKLRHGKMSVVSWLDKS